MQKIPFSLKSSIKFFESRIFAMGRSSYTKHEYFLCRPQVLNMVGRTESTQAQGHWMSSDSVTSRLLQARFKKKYPESVTKYTHTHTQTDGTDFIPPTADSGGKHLVFRDTCITYTTSCQNTNPHHVMKHFKNNRESAHPKLGCSVLQGIRVTCM